MEALFTHKGWGLLWLLRRMRGCSRAKRSPTGAWVTGDCFLGCGISPRCNRVVQGRIPLYVQLDKASMRLIRVLFNFIEMHGSSFYPKGLGVTLVTAEVARLFPRAAQSYKGWGCRHGRWYRVVRVVNITGMMNVETLSV